MSIQLRAILNTEINMIDISHLWPILRQRQYYNAMCELKNELEILSSLPNLKENLKVKIAKSLERITFLVDKLKEKL
jgi:hypothetical protein